MSFFGMDEMLVFASGNPRRFERNVEFRVSGEKILYRNSVRGGLLEGLSIVRRVLMLKKPVGPTPSCLAPMVWFEGNDWMGIDLMAHEECDKNLQR